MVVTAADLAAEALFASDLQPSQQPTPAQVRAAIDAMVTRYGTVGCAACVAVEYGDHPETAMRRMAWARAMAMLAVNHVPMPKPAG